MNQVATIEEPKRKSLVTKLADRFEVDADKLLPTLKQTAFRTDKQISNEQMMALLIVCDQYKLNPFLKEIFAYPDKGSIVPVVSVDGWSRIINENPNFDGVEFEYSPETVKYNGHTCHEWIDCILYRKDRSQPTKVREFFSEVKLDRGPWKSHPNRMHRHKTFIQASRIAFGFAGIYDQDEAERIVEAKKVADISDGEKAKEGYNQEQHDYFHQLVKDYNAIEFYAFIKSIPEGVYMSLYDTFEQGKKMEGKKKCGELEKEGREMVTEIARLISDAAEANDDIALKENMEGLSNDAIAMVLDQATAEGASFYRAVMGESDD